jgi:cytoskeletal protein RodZ
MYNASIDAWVEPVTGAIVKGSKHVQQWAQLNGQKVLALADVTVTYNPPTVDKLTSDAEKNKKQLKLVKSLLPIALPIVGIPLAVVGVLLLRPPKPKKVATTREKASSDDTSEASPDSDRDSPEPTRTEKAPTAHDSSGEASTDGSVEPVASQKPGEPAEPAEA